MFGACVHSGRVLVAVTLAFALALLCTATAPGSVYWANANDGTIGRANLDGGSVTQSFLTLPGSGIRGIALDGGYLLWSHGNWPAGAIGRVGLDGTSPDAGFVPTTGSPAGLAVDDTRLYWADESNGSEVFSGSIGRALLDGTAPDERFIQGAAWTVEGVAVDAAHVYWTNGSGYQRVGRANLDGTAVNQALAASDDPPDGVAVDGTYIYWSERGRIARAQLDGSNVAQDFISTGVWAYGIAVDGHHIYWATGAAIGRANLDGTDVRPQWITGLNGAWTVAVDDRIATATTLTASPASAIYGQDQTFTASVTAPGGAPASGTVAFTVTGEPVVTVPLASDGTAVYDPPYLLNVGDTVTARYNGDALQEPSSTHLAVDLRPARTALTVTLAPNPATVGTDVTLTVAATNLDTPIIPFGAVRVVIDNEWVDEGPLDDAGQATGTLTPFEAGDYRITVSYYDDTGTRPNFVESEQTVVEHVIAPATASATSSPGTPPTPTMSLNRPAATTRASLSAMTKPLLRALHRRGFGALNTVGQTLTVSAPGTLSQLVYSPSAPANATTADKAKPVLVARATHRFPEAGRGKLRLRVTAAGRRLARRAAALKIQIITRFAPTIGSPLSVRSRITVKARGRR